MRLSVRCYSFKTISVLSSPRAVPVFAGFIRGPAAKQSLAVADYCGNSCGSFRDQAIVEVDDFALRTLRKDEPTWEGKSAAKLFWLAAPWRSSVVSPQVRKVIARRI